MVFYLTDNWLPLLIKPQVFPRKDSSNFKSAFIFSKLSECGGLEMYIHQWGLSITCYFLKLPMYLHGLLAKFNSHFHWNKTGVPPLISAEPLHIYPSVPDIRVWKAVCFILDCRFPIPDYKYLRFKFTEPRKENKVLFNYTLPRKHKNSFKGESLLSSAHDLQ